jgi:hypothetical protein
VVPRPGGRAYKRNATSRLHSGLALAEPGLRWSLVSGKFVPLALGMQGQMSLATQDSLLCKTAQIGGLAPIDSN